MWIRNEVHRRKDGGVTIKPRFVGWKRKPRRKRRDNHGTRRALIHQHRGQGFSRRFK